ncbi:MAG: phosphatase [Angelakisella sp.]|jgi:DNA-damage-inducible protein J|nr:phosphatase [Angelakisella sp.]
MDLVSLPKTDSFRIRVNPEVRRQLEAIYGRNGLTLTDAVNVFFQQSLNAGGFPFSVTDDNTQLVKAKALARLMKELEAGEKDPKTYTEEEVYRRLGVERE